MIDKKLCDIALELEKLFKYEDTYNRIAEILSMYKQNKIYIKDCIRLVLWAPELDYKFLDLDLNKDTYINKYRENNEKGE